MTDLIDFVRLLTAVVSFFTALVGLSEGTQAAFEAQQKGSPPLRR